MSRGKLSYTVEGPVVTLENGTILQSNSCHPDISYSVVGSVARKRFPIDEDYKIKLKSRKITRKYSRDSFSQYEMYPPSSDGWITHLSEIGSDALFVVQEITNSQKYLLSIIDLDNVEILGIHSIHPYEIDIIFQETDWTFYNRLQQIASQVDRSFIDELLEAPPPDWPRLESIGKGIIVPGLEKHSTMRAAVEQFVPKSFPEQARVELMAFLAWVMNAKIPEEDPLDFHNRLQPTPILRSLILGHIQCILEGIEPPQYARIINLAERGELLPAKQPATEAAQLNPWNVAWYRLMEMFPDQQGRVLALTHKMNIENEIITSLPVTRQEAMLSRQNWFDRFASIFHTLFLKGHIQSTKVGLRTLVYFGSAHRWPHKHLAWTARLGPPHEKVPYLQVMVMPSSAVERVQRVRANVSIIEWSASAVNLGLFNVENQRWNIPLSRLMSSMQGKRTRKELSREFKLNEKHSTFFPNKIEAATMDFLSVGIYLSGLELGIYRELLPSSNEELKDIITSLRERGIVDIQYFYSIAGLVSICLIANGPSSQVQSISRSFLKYVPSTTVRLANGGNTSYIMSRVPEDKAYEILTKMPLRAKEYDIDIKAKRVDAYAGYTNNLYSRLLKSDGTWDDDISNFLSQIRS